MFVVVLSTNPIRPLNLPLSATFQALGEAAARYDDWFTRTATATSVTPEVRRSPVAGFYMAAFMDDLYNNEMVEVVGINNITGLAFASEILDATAGYINVYAGYCWTVVDQFPILPVTATYMK